MTNHESGNRVIAEFMGIKLLYYSGESNMVDIGRKIVPLSRWAKYHTSWDWIMPVVEKIDMMDSGKVDCQVIIETFSVRIRYFDGKNKYEWANGGSSKIDSCWTAIVRFINWYITQKTITHA